MAQARWCVFVEIQNTGEDVTAAPLPSTVGPKDAIQRGALPARLARTLLPYYARNQSSDLTGFYRLDGQNTSSPVTLNECIGIAQPGQWVETAPIDFVTDAGEVTKVKSNDTFAVRVRTRWDKADTSIVPQFKQLRFEIVLRRDNTPSPPDFVVLNSHTFSISTSMTTYTASLALDTWWASNHRYLLRCVGRFYRQIQI